MQQKKFFTTQTLAMLALLTAMSILFSRILSINLSNSLKISTGFIPIAIAGYLFGPIGGMLVGGLTDFIGAHLFPVGAYFVGFTITATLSGLFYGFFLYHEKPLLKLNGKYTSKLKDNTKLIIRCLLCCTCINLFNHLFLNTIWISILFGNAFWALVPIRTFKTLIMIPIEALILSLIVGSIARMPKHWFNNSIIK